MRIRTGKWIASGLAALVVISGLVVGQAAMATPLNLDLLPVGVGADPDIFVGFGSVTYTAATDQFVWTGQPQTFFSGGANYPITANIGDFSLTATIDDFGVMTSGSFTVAGTAAGLGFNSGTLLTGTLTDFGFGGAGSVLEWNFTPTGGDAAGLYNTTGVGGIILGGSNFQGDWTSDFSASFTATADIGVVPEPSTALLVGLGLMGLALRGRRQA